MSEKIIKNGIIRIIANIFKGSSSIYSDIMTLLNLEFKLAKLSILFLIIFSILFLILLSSAWLMLMGALTVFLYSLLSNWVFAFLITFIFNVFLIILFLVLILNLCKNLTFSATRRQLLSLQNKV